MILAKSKKVNEVEVGIKEHSVKVRDVAIYIAQLSDPTIDSKLLERIGKGGYLHDIGKAEEGFQDHIQKDIKTKGKFYNHQEISWAFLQGHTDLDKISLNAIYWHHGVSRFPFNIKDLESAKDILMNIDISDMKKFYEDEYGSISKIKGNLKKRIPLYYDSEYSDDELIELMFMRMCIISADRLVSANISIDDIKTKIDLNIRREIDFKIDVCPFKNSERFDKQKEIVSKAGRWSAIKAPAGFGKTLIGLMWIASSEDRRKILWVCPRNTIAESVYLSILDELKTTNNSNVSVELFLTGETKNNNTDKVDFSADIIVTNIDNFLKPNCDISNADKMYLVNNCDIIFDEFHELVTEAALYKLFFLVNEMRAVYTKKTRTLYLSATPSLMLDRFNNFSVEYFPSKTEHYSSHNQKFFYFEVKDINDLDFTKSNNCTLQVFNSIANAQEYYNDDSLFFHSNFKESVKKSKFDELYNGFNKNSRRRSDKKNQIGTPIIQASLDVSFRNLWECILSPEATVQRMGRCDRFVDYRKQSNIISFTNTDNSNTKTIGILYNNYLNKKWTEYLIGIQGRITLDEFYRHYNKFNVDNRDMIHKMYDVLESASDKNMENIYPISYKQTSKKSEVVDANGNKIRNIGDNIFFLAYSRENNEWVGPFSVELYNNQKIDEQFKEGTDILHKIKKIHNFFYKNKMFNFGVRHQINKRSLDSIRRMARKSDTPYIRFDVEYDEKLGLIKVK